MDDERELRRLEERLRSGRPKPRPAFLTELVSRLEQPAPASSRRVPRFRLGLALAFAVLFIAAGGALGGFGHASTAVTDAAKAVPAVATDIVEANQSEPQAKDGQFGAAGDVSNSLKSAHAQYPTYSTICHQPGTPAEQTLVVNDNALGGHLGHGDALGPCDENGDGE